MTNFLRGVIHFVWYFRWPLLAIGLAAWGLARLCLGLGVWGVIIPVVFVIVAIVVMMIVAVLRGVSGV